MAVKYITFCMLTLPLAVFAAPVLEIPATRGQWDSRRPHLLEQWQKIIGPLPQRQPLDVKIISTEQVEDHTRILIEYPGNDAYILLPKTRSPGKRPGMIVLHPTSDQHIRGPVGLANRETNHHALHLVRRGYVCIAPRNFLWQIEGRTWQQAADDVLKSGEFKTGMARMLHDARCAVDILAARPEVDADRLGAIGHSLGGKESLYLAAFDDRIKATISSEGGVGLSFSNWDADWYLGRQIKSPDFHHDNHQIIALIAPRALMVIGGESADGTRSKPYIDACLPLWRLYAAENRLRLLLHDEGHSFPQPGPNRQAAYNWLDAMLEG